MRKFDFCLFALVLISGCAATGVKTEPNGELLAANDAEEAPYVLDLKCQCGSTFSIDDVYFP